MEIKKENYNDYIVYIDKLSKSFLSGKIKANEDITLKIKKNDVYALMGENGAGKSTLMSMLFGIYKPDSGQIYIRGKKVNFKYAYDAHKENIGMVHQHFKLVDDFTVHENIILGNEFSNDKLPIKNIFIDKKKSKEKINNLIEKYNLKIDINKKVKTLNVSEKQKVEILKLLFLDSEILIFDEPTAILSKDEIKNFLIMIKNFKKEGKTIILITHKIDEVFEVANRGGIIRKGKTISEFDIKSMNEKKISSLMVGREVKKVINKNEDKFGEVVLSVKDLSINGSEKFSFDIREGEIFSIAGISDNGQTELADLISGMSKPSNEKNEKENQKTKILIKGIDKKNKNIESLIDTTNMSIGKKYKVGMGFVPEDRQKHGLILEDSISYNFALNKFNTNYDSSFLYEFPAMPFMLKILKIINWKKIDSKALELVKEFDVQGVSSITDNVGGLSGGNQQKVIIGREMTKNSKLLILFQPTRGLDIGSIEMIHKKIIKEKEKGKAILLISYELSEIFNLSDTIAVMSENKIIKIAPAKKLSIEKVGELMTFSHKGVS